MCVAKAPSAKEFACGSLQNTQLKEGGKEYVALPCPYSDVRLKKEGGKEYVALPCPYSDVRLKKEGGKEYVALQCPYSDVRLQKEGKGAEDNVKAKIQDKKRSQSSNKICKNSIGMEKGKKKESGHFKDKEDLKAVPSSFTEFIDSVKENETSVEKAEGLKDVHASFDAYISSSLAYHVTTGSSLWNPSPPVLRLELLLAPVATELKLPAATVPPPSGDSGIDFGRCPSPSEEEFEMIETIPWETYIREKEEMEEKEKEKGGGLMKEKDDLWETYFLKRKENVENERKMEGEGTEVELKVPESKRQEVMKLKGLRKVRRGTLPPSEATKARAEELTRGVRALLFPGRLKRKHTAFVRSVSINAIANANSSRVRFEEEEKEKEKEKEKEEEYGSVQQQSYYRPCLFVFGAGSETGSEVLFKGGVLEQVGEGEPLPEPEKIRFLHRLGGRLQTAILGGSETLAGWARQFWGDGTKEVDGYFTTKGGRILNSQLPAGKLGLHGSQEVVLQGRLRGGGYSGGGKGVRGGGGNSVAAGDWTCGICNQTGCWNAKPTCYRCGAPRQPTQGFSGPASSGGWDMGGRYQGGVGTGMGGSRVVGPTGRDQSSVPGGNPTHRKGPQPGGKGRNKVGGDTGAGVGFGFGTGGGVVGGGEEVTTVMPSPGWVGVVGLVIRCHRAW